MTNQPRGSALDIRQGPPLGWFTPVFWRAPRAKPVTRSHNGDKILVRGRITGCKEPCSMQNVFAFCIRHFAF